MIFTNNGHEVKNTEGLKVLSYVNGVPVYKRVKRIIRHKVSKKKFKITVGGKSIIITEDHDMVVIRNDKMKRISPKNIEKNDEIVYIAC